MLSCSLPFWGCHWISTGSMAALLKCVELKCISYWPFFAMFPTGAHKVTFIVTCLCHGSLKLHPHGSTLCDSWALSSEPTRDVFWCCGSLILQCWITVDWNLVPDKVKGFIFHWEMSWVSLRHALNYALSCTLWQTARVNVQIAVKNWVYKWPWNAWNAFIKIWKLYFLTAQNKNHGYVANLQCSWSKSTKSRIEVESPFFFWRCFTFNAKAIFGWL